eukprot:XP_001708400.1 Hypothetical protein GL50803_35480 [Giardia lamblia ATCC 50803]
MRAWTDCLGRPKHHLQVCCAMQGDADHIVTEPDALHRVSVDMISCWMTDHIMSKKRCTVIHEQKVWVDHDKENQSRTSSFQTPARPST